MPWASVEQWSNLTGSSDSGFIVGEWIGHPGCLHRSCPSDPATRFLGRALLGSGALPKILYLKKKVLKHWLCGDRSQQSALSSKSSDYLILDSAAQRSENSWGSSGTFFFELKKKHLAGTEENGIPAWPLSHSPFLSCWLFPFPPQNFLGLPTALKCQLLLEQPQNIFFQFYEVPFCWVTKRPNRVNSLNGKGVPSSEPPRTSKLPID